MQEQIPSRSFPEQTQYSIANQFDKQRWSETKQESIELVD